MSADGNDSKAALKPFVFIAHSDSDKPLLERIIGCLLDDGIDVVIDTISTLQRFSRYVAAGRLRQMSGGLHWERDLIEILEAPASYVLGFISLDAARSDHPDHHRVLRLELEEARKAGKLQLIEIETGARDAYRSLPTVHHRLSVDLQWLRLRDDTFTFDYDLIGQTVSNATGRKICFGGGGAFERLRAEQAQAALALRGSRTSTETNRYDASNRCFRCILVPGDGARVEPFWLTARPVAEVVHDPQEVQRMLDETLGFRLPTEAQLARALAPRGAGLPGGNPFGFTTDLADGLWAQCGGEIAVTGGDGRPPAAVQLVYTG